MDDVIALGSPTDLNLGATLNSDTMASALEKQEEGARWKTQEKNKMTELT